MGPIRQRKPQVSSFGGIKSKSDYPVSWRYERFYLGERLHYRTRMFSFGGTVRKDRLRGWIRIIYRKNYADLVDAVPEHIVFRISYARFACAGA